MKRVLILFMLTVLGITACSAQQPKTDSDINWFSNLEDALAQAKSKNLPVIVDFTGSDWCIWCKKLDAEVFAQKSFSDYAKKNLIMVKLDFPKSIKQTQEIKDYNRAILDKYGVQGFPTIVILNSKGDEIGRTGYQQGGPDAYIEHLKTFLK